VSRLTALLLALYLTPSLVLAQSTELALVGEARLKFLFWPVYDSRLYSENGSYRDTQRPVRLEIQYLRDIEAQALVEQTGNAWQQQRIPAQQQQLWLQALSELWPDVSKNDVLTLHIDEQNKSTFYRNGELLGSIDDVYFGQSFLNIWLSPDTSRPRLRQNLLGLK
jgi:hypothetical protein